MVIRENLENREDSDLVRMCVDGREDALGELYSRYHGMIFNHLYRMVHDRVLAEDLTEETFFRVWRKASLYREDRGSFKTWLYRMTTHLAINRINKRTRRDRRAGRVPLPEHDVADGAPGPHEEAGVSEARRMVHEAMGKLSNRDRAVLSLRHLEGLGEKEVAGILGIPKGTVKSRTYHAVRRLKVALEGMGF